MKNKNPHEKCHENSEKKRFAQGFEKTTCGTTFVVVYGFIISYMDPYGC